MIGAEGAGGLHAHLRRKDIFIRGLDTLFDPRYDGVYCLVKYLRLEFQVSKGNVRRGTRRIFIRDGLNFRWPCYNLVFHYLVQRLHFIFRRPRTDLQKVFVRGVSHLEKNFGGKESATCKMKKNLTTHHTLYPLASRVLFNRNRRTERSDASKFPRQRDGSAVKKKSLDGSCITMPLDGMRTACESGC